MKKLSYCIVVALSLFILNDVANANNSTTEKDIQYANAANLTPMTLNEYLITSKQKEQVNLIQDAFFNSFNQTTLSPEDTARKYFSKKLQFYAGDTNKIIDYDAMIGRIKSVRREYKSVDFVFANFTFSSSGNSVAESHYVYAQKLNGDTVIIKTSNMYHFDQDGKINTIYNVEQTLRGDVHQALHDAYMTK
jgi:hypothetical protein